MVPIMTKLMKVEAVIYYILKIVGYICGIIGVLSVLGYVGSLERDVITIAQFCVYEVHAFCLIGASCILYYIRERIADDFIARDHQLRKMRRQRMLSAKQAGQYYTNNNQY